jgi:hypothetical protein
MIKWWQFGFRVILLSRASLIKTILLIAIIGLAFFMALYPRLDYPYPLHVDEWMHLGHTTQVLNTGHLDYPNPFQGGRWEVGGHPETGYYLWLGTSLLATGSPWLELARLMPALVLGLIAFLSYAWGRKWGFGLEAAFLATFIHTTIRFLGPAFLVPVTLGLVFFPLCLMLLEKMEQGWRPLPLIVVSLIALFLTHGTTAVAVGFVLVIYLLFYLIFSQNPLREKLPSITCILLIPFSALVIFLWNRAFVLREIQNIINAEKIPLDPIPIPLPQLGYIMVALAVIGFGFLIARGGWRNYALLVPTVVLLFFVQLYRQWFEIGPDILYERGWLYVMLLMAFIAGYGLSQLRQLGLDFFKRWRWGMPAVYVALALVVVFAVVQRMDGYAKERYYHVIDTTSYHDFKWIGEELPKDSVVLLNPYVGWAVVPISGGQYVYTAKASPWGMEEAMEIRAFFLQGATDTEYIREKKANVIYSEYPLENPDLIEVREGVYILREGS